jgi:deazaflavin-dependent oxidoreductase (nitroreductase family)
MESEPRSGAQPFDPPGAGERVFSKLFGLLVGFGLGASHHFLVEVRGRKTGRRYSTPVDVLTLEARRYLVAPRGYTQWVRNASAAGTVVLRKGRRHEECTLRALVADEKPLVLKAYLDRYKLAVQRYFPVPAGSPPEAFRPYVDRYPAFELRTEAVTSR